MGYKAIFTGRKTSLKLECVNNNCLASEFDNIFYNTLKIKFIKSGTLDFYKRFRTLKGARLISDHIPAWFEFSVN